ncbi:MAG: COX15/CtaA family protein [candidate division NC10 bacterium]|nr:COX15/CtaA family protein [candidate division NC10 bacterium]
MLRSDRMSSSGRQWPGDRVWLHRIAVLNAGATFLLILAGGLVTNTGSGMAVPDWPATFGQNMFLFPWSRMVDGIFYEHSHRLVGSAVGVLTLALAVALWIREPRPWLRWLGIGALVAVLIQGVLGGLRVVLVEDSLAIVHGVVAQAFFALTVSLALFTSRAWIGAPARSSVADAGPLGILCLSTTGILYMQIVFGALLTHVGATLGAHLATAGVVLVLACVLAARIRRCRVELPQLIRPVILLCGLLILQLVLGLGAYMARFTSVPLPLGQVSVLAFPVLHRLNAGLLLVTSLVLTLRTFRLLGCPARRRGPGWVSGELSG